MEPSGWRSLAVAVAVLTGCGAGGDARGLGLRHLGALLQSATDVAKDRQLTIGDLARQADVEVLPRALA